MSMLTGASCAGVVSLLSFTSSFIARGGSIVRGRSIARGGSKVRGRSIVSGGSLIRAG